MGTLSQHAATAAKLARKTPGHASSTRKVQTKHKSKTPVVKEEDSDSESASSSSGDSVSDASPGRWSENLEAILSARRSETKGRDPASKMAATNGKKIKKSSSDNVPSSLSQSESDSSSEDEKPSAKMLGDRRLVTNMVKKEAVSDSESSDGSSSDSSDKESNVGAKVVTKTTQASSRSSTSSSGSSESESESESEDEVTTKAKLKATAKGSAATFDKKALGAVKNVPEGKKSASKAESSSSGSDSESDEDDSPETMALEKRNGKTAAYVLVFFFLEGLTANQPSQSKSSRDHRPQLSVAQSGREYECSRCCSDLSRCRDRRKADLVFHRTSISSH